MSPPTSAQLRQVLLDVLPTDVSSDSRPPDLHEVYIPPAHLKALRLDASLVVGARGVGKTFWASVLQKPDTVQTLLNAQIHELTQTTVWTGFGVAPDLDAYPDDGTFNALIQQGAKAYDIWSAVVARPLARLQERTIPAQSWQATVTWVQNNAESFARLLQEANHTLQQQQRYGLFVFDALDRTVSNDDWDVMDHNVRELLRVALKLKSYSRLRAKVFVREDQSMRAIANFVDASKLIASQVDLDWAINDLYGLLWQTLINAPELKGQMLRQVYEEVTGQAPNRIASTWQVHEPLKRDAALQRRLFERLAGDKMGLDTRRGVPYVWTVSHLADGHGRTSPRSFLVAIRTAAEETQQKYPDHPLVLHYEGIRRGVQKASEIRVKEVEEDYKNVRAHMTPLQGLSVPCAFKQMIARWEESRSNPELPLDTDLPPVPGTRDWFHVKDDLIRLGVFQTMQDGRINMPDLYRVGFNLGRRGGVKPLKPR